MGTKISELTELTSVVPADVLIVVDDFAGSPITKYSTITNFLKVLGGVPAMGAAPAVTDKIPVIDITDGSAKYMTVTELLQSMANFSDMGTTPDAGDYFFVRDATDGSIKKVSYSDLGIGTTGDSIVKGWCHLNGTGTIAINDSYNVSGITDRGTGQYTVTWDTDFANANYCPVMSVTDTCVATINAMATGSVEINARDVTAAGAVADVANCCVIAIGDQ